MSTATRRLGAAMLIGVTAPLVFVSNSAGADQRDEWREGVTSGSSSYESVSQAVCTHGGGEISVRQTGSNPDAVGRYRIINTVSGGTAGFGNVSDGGVADLDGVISGTHRLQVRRDEPKDTNGFFVPGSGVTTFEGAYRCPD